MASSPFLLDLDRVGSSYSLLLAFVGLGVLAGLLFWSGIVGRVLGLVSLLIHRGIAAGFWLWKRLLAWATWPLFLALVVVVLLAGLASEPISPFLPLLCGVTLLLLGVTTCLAYMSIDLERYEVARGYKALHNPLKGQELAINLVRHGPQVGVPLLAAATVGVVAGFALTNQGLYETVGRDWYRLEGGSVEPGYADFLAYTLINLFRVADLLHIASSYNYVHATYVQQAQWPAATLLSLFKTFFTLVLLQQIFASVRRGRLLVETIADFWSPHPPIHERARVSLPQHGPGAVRPLLLSLRSVEVLTAEQRSYIPRIIADIGPSAIPVLTHHLLDPHDHVRGVAAAALGHLHALESVPELVRLGPDPSDWVRQALAESLGSIGSANAAASHRRRFTRRVVRASRLWLWLRVHLQQKRVPAPRVNPIELAVSTLRALLADPSASVRIQAIRSLGLVGSAGSTAASDLIRLLQDADEAVRCQSAESLGIMEGPAGEKVTALATLLQDPSPPIRVAAAKALGSLKKAAAEAVPALLPLLQEGDETIRLAAAEAVNQIGTMQGEALQALGEGLSSGDNIVPRRRPRRWARSARPQRRRLLCWPKRFRMTMTACAPRPPRRWASWGRARPKRCPSS